MGAKIVAAATAQGGGSINEHHNTHAHTLAKVAELSSVLSGWLSYIVDAVMRMQNCVTRTQRAHGRMSALEVSLRARDAIVISSA